MYASLLFHHRMYNFIHSVLCGLPLVLIRVQVSQLVHKRRQRFIYKSNNDYHLWSGGDVLLARLDKESIATAALLLLLVVVVLIITSSRGGVLMAVVEVVAGRFYQMDVRCQLRLIYYLLGFVPVEMAALCVCRAAATFGPTSVLFLCSNLCMLSPFPMTNVYTISKREFENFVACFSIEL
ncbi:conserved hypothetical protein [Trichinella spiralis]|uniref:hypothetical protein n=1 Tax=Trichinella spiralis TaxID=6334 RepID=UPI0001EFD846|nr:conserved hypothetical protein [Trichinella spiralis]